MRKRSLTILLPAILVLVLAFALQGFAAPPKQSTAKKKGKEAAQAQPQVSAEEAFKKNFPNIKYDAINPTDMKGIYEVVVGTNIGYFSPETGYLIIGEVRDKTGQSITANRRAEIVASKSKDLPLDKAIKIGAGPSKVIEFTDPDCPFCRKAATFFKDRTDVTKYVFFMPLPGHPDAENKSKYVLCADDRAKAYEEAMSGKLDDKKYEVCKKPEVDETLKSYKDLAAKMGINSTPFFIVNGKAITGADIPRLEEALKQGNK